MNDLPSILLLQQNHATPHTGEDLETLGKEAACRYACGECRDLSTAVVETVKHAGLSPEQVKRVVEFANVNAYLDEFKKMSSAHKFVAFQGGPASPAEVLRDLNDGGGGNVFDRGSLDDYSKPPTKTASVRRVSGSGPLEKTAASTPLPVTPNENEPQMPPPPINGQAMTELSPEEQAAFAELKAEHPDLTVDQFIALVRGDDAAMEHAFANQFATPGQPEERFANPYAEVESVRDKISNALEVKTAEINHLEVDLYDALEQLYGQVKHASTEGVPLSHVLRAWQEVVPGPDYVKIAFSHIGPRLVDEGVFDGFDAVGGSLMKVASASGVVNPAHPIVRSMVEYTDALDKLAQAHADRNELSVEYDRITSFMVAAMEKEAFVGKGLQWLAEHGGVIPNITGAFAKASPHVGGAVRRVGEALLGSGSAGAQRAGELAGTAVKYLPHAAAAVGGGLAAKEVYDRAKYSPMVRGVYNYGMSHVPYTHQNLVREYNMQMGGG